MFFHFSSFIHSITILLAVLRTAGAGCKAFSANRDFLNRSECVVVADKVHTYRHLKRIIYVHHYTLLIDTWAINCTASIEEITTQTHTHTHARTFKSLHTFIFINIYRNDFASHCIEYDGAAAGCCCLGSLILATEMRVPNYHSLKNANVLRLLFMCINEHSMHLSCKSWKRKVFTPLVCDFWFGVRSNT